MDINGIVISYILLGLMFRARKRNLEYIHNTYNYNRPILHSILDIILWPQLELVDRAQVIRHGYRKYALHIVLNTLVLITATYYTNLLSYSLVANFIESSIIVFILSIFITYNFGPPIIVFCSLIINGLLQFVLERLSSKSNNDDLPPPLPKNI